jgi:transposase
MLPEFKEQINAVELQMQARLAEIRQRLHHRGNKGASVEAVVREFLREYLPRRFDVGHGEIVDQQGQRSPQTDVVIVNEDHPGTFTHNEPGLFFRALPAFVWVTPISA